MPTVLLGYEPAPPAYPAPPPPPEGYPAPPEELVPIYSTPVPTATPYIRTGADFFERQRVAIGPLIVAAERAGRNVRVTLENRTAAPVEVHLTVSVVRTVRADDGRLIEGVVVAEQRRTGRDRRALDGNRRADVSDPAGRAAGVGHAVYQRRAAAQRLERQRLCLVALCARPALRRAGRWPAVRQLWAAASRSTAPVVGRAGWPVPDGHGDLARLRLSRVLDGRARRGLPGEPAVVAQRHRLRQRPGHADLCRRAE